jgi:hypothetical protein
MSNLQNTNLDSIICMVDFWLAHRGITVSNLASFSSIFLYIGSEHVLNLLTLCNFTFTSIMNI